MKKITKSALQFLVIIQCAGFSVLCHGALNESKSSDNADVEVIMHKMSSPEEENKHNKTLINEPIPRGQLLYENHCKTCHQSMVHIRERNKVRSYSDIQYWVGRWALELNVKWSAEEIDAVVQYLNSKFYQF